MIFYTIDTSAYDAAQQEYNLFLNWYALAKGRPDVREWGMRLHSYKTLFGPYREVPLFNYNEKVVIFDVFTNRIVHLNQDYSLNASYKFDLEGCSKDFVAIQDEVNEKIWLFYRKRGLDHLIPIKDAHYISGNPVFLDLFIRNVRVQNDIAYFLDENYEISFKSLN